MKVSVIVPVYNTSKYLKQCLASLKRQTLKEIEVICVNDGSTDESREIIEQFVTADHRFHAIHKSNTGYGHSVNLGIQAAQAPYIGVVESDDFAEPDMFQNLYEAAERSQADLVKGNYHTYSDNSPTPAVFEEMLAAFPYGQVISPKDSPGIFGVHPSVWASLYRKSFLTENDIWFLETPGASYQDIAFAFKVNANAEQVCFIKKAVLNYRIDNVESSVYNPQKIFCVCDELKEIERYLDERAAVEAWGAGWHKELGHIAAWIKFRNYMWNYTRLSLPYQYAFLMRVREELREVCHQGYDLDVWNEWEKATLTRMVDETDEFFIETAKGYEDARLQMIPVLNHSFSVRCFQELVLEHQEIYIYGAGLIGKQVWNYLKKVHISQKVKGFIVSETGNNPKQLQKKPVLVLHEVQNSKESLVIVAVQKQYHCEIVWKLQEEGYKHILLLDEKMKSWLNEYLQH